MGKYPTRLRCRPLRRCQLDSPITQRTAHPMPGHFRFHVSHGSSGMRTGTKEATILMAAKGCHAKVLKPRIGLEYSEAQLTWRSPRQQAHIRTGARSDEWEAESQQPAGSQKKERKSPLRGCQVLRILARVRPRTDTMLGKNVNSLAMPKPAKVAMRRVIRPVTYLHWTRKPARKLKVNKRCWSRTAPVIIWSPDSAQTDLRGGQAYRQVGWLLPFLPPCRDGLLMYAIVALPGLHTYARRRCQLFFFFTVDFTELFPLHTWKSPCFEHKSLKKKGPYPRHVVIYKLFSLPSLAAYWAHGLLIRIPCPCP